MKPDCLFTLDLPRVLEDDVLDALMQYPNWASRIQLLESEAAGSAVRLLQATEKVRGRAVRSQLSLLIQSEQVQALCQVLDEHFANADMQWWVTPVMASGRL